MDQGIYALGIWLDQPQEIQVGRKGCILFPAGWYLYVGSAQQNCSARISRHLRRRKPLRWHIDYLTQHASVRRVGVWPVGKAEECRLARHVLTLPGAQVLAGGLGSSDCECPTHLIYLGESLPWRSIEEAMEDGR